MPKQSKSPAINFSPVTPSKWNDFVKLFGKHGACGGCWCMSMRMVQKDFAKTKGEKNKRAIKRIIDSGNPPGLIGYVDGEPASWCCIGPREDFKRLSNSRSLQPIDDNPVWSIPCLFVAKPFRKRGISSLSIDAATNYAFSKGADIVEGYPNDTKQKKWADPFVWMGLVASFKRAGFKQVKRPSPSRAIMRRYKKD